MSFTIGVLLLFVAIAGKHHFFHCDFVVVVDIHFILKTVAQDSTTAPVTTTEATTASSTTTAAASSSGASSLPSSSSSSSFNASAYPVPTASLIRVESSTLDNDTTDWAQAYIAQAPANTSDARFTLLVFLSDSRVDAEKYSSFIGACAAQGYHCISLPWPNTLFASTACSAVGGECVPFFREQVITGEPKTTILQLPRDDAIEPRLTRFLKALSIAAPMQGWTSIADNWRSSVIFSGIGEGGTYATFWGCRLLQAKRIILFGAPFDRDAKSNVIAKWLSSGECKTAKENIFSMYHTEDHNCEAAIEGIGAIGVTPPSTQVIAYVPEVPDKIQDWCAINARQLCTSLLSRNKLEIDGARSVVQDSFVPQLKNGELEYRRVWDYLLGTPTCTKLASEMIVRGSCACTTSDSLSSMQIGLIIGLIVLLVVCVLIGAFAWWKKKKNKSGF
jgi:hypothetical protein